MAAAHSEARVEAAARFMTGVGAVSRSEAGVKAASCSRPKIEDGRW
jgi:hypothetical protein